MSQGKSGTWLGIGMLLSLLFGGPLAATTTEEPETFEDSAAVVVVEVPVQVVDADGVPVKGLKPENFEILDGKEQRQIVGFEVIDRAEAPHGGRSSLVPPSGRRHFLLLFDLSFSNPSAILKARSASLALLERLHPTDLVAVGTFSVLKGTELLLRFTPDRQQARLAIETLGTPQLIDRSPDPLGLMIGSVEGNTGTPGSSGRGALADEREALVLEHLKQVEGQTGRQNREAQGARVQGMMKTMTDLAGLMRSVDGRKYVVFLSEGFDSKLLTGEGGGDEDTQSSIEFGETWKVDTDSMYGSGRLQNVLEETLNQLRRADCTIQAVDIGGLRAEGEGPVIPNGQEGLFAMARGTGGDLYRNFNDLGEAMSRMLARTSLTYVLTFQPDDVLANGEYRPLKVRLKNAPRGARIVHRPGYFTPKPEGLETAEERRLAIAGELLAKAPGGELAVAVLAVPFAREGGKAAVPVLIEMDGPRLAANSSTSALSAEVYAYALDADGKVADYLFQTLQLDLTKLGERLKSGGVKLYGVLDLPPGNYTLRALVRNPANQRSGLAEATVEVPEFAPSDLVALPPLAPDMDLGRWLMVRQPAQPGEAEFPYPFTLGEAGAFVPAVRPTQVGSTPLQLSLYAYHVGSGPLVLSGELRNERGDVVLGRQLPIVQRTGGSAGQPEQLLTAFAAEGVPPGRYTLTVAVLESATGRRDLASTPLLIEPGAAGPGSIAGLAEAELPPARLKDSERIAVLRKSYEKVLAKLSSGYERDAAQLLVEMEQAEQKATDDLLLEDLHDAEVGVARELARQAPDALIPVTLLHESAYLGYRTPQTRLLARHSRVMVQELAELYVDAGGSPTSLAADVFTSLGGSLQEAGLTTSANSLFLRALDLQESNEGALLSLAVYAEKVGDYARAVKHLESLVEGHPDNSEAWLRLGVNLLRLGKRQQGSEWLSRARSPQALPWVRSLAHAEAARLAQREGNLEGAERLLRDAVATFPEDQQLKIQLANVLDRIGRGGEARAVLTEVAPAAGGAPSARLLYNRWPASLLERRRLELRNTATTRLAVLARAMTALNMMEAAR